jgi:hypothetical protein
MSARSLHLRLAELHAEIGAVHRELAELPAADDGEPYGSRPPYQAPPGRSHRWVRDHARLIEGHRREGGERGRDVVWLLPREAYSAWLSARSTARSTPTEPTADVVAIDSWIAAAGYRQTRGGR